MRISAPLRICLLTLLAVIIVFSCENSGDQRNTTRKALGEPDIMENYLYTTFETEIWVYARKDINRVYEFRKTLSSCGGSGEWYLAQRYLANGSYYFNYELYDPPPVITHEPVVSAPVGHSVNIQATVVLSDDVEVDTVITGVRLHYQTFGDSLFTTVGMSTQTTGDSIFTAQIPAETMTAEGAEYYIEACSNDNTSVSYHWSRLPETKETYYFISPTPEKTSVQKTGIVESTGDVWLPANLPEPDTGPSSLSPISP
ncbi:hypothetical protein ACFL5H_02240 [Candidatus Latescibacterota bacterium]